MINCLVLLLSVLGIVASVATSEPPQMFDVACPNHPVVSDFDLAKFAGYWYEIYRYRGGHYPKGECVRSNITVINNLTLSMVSEMVVLPSTEIHWEFNTAYNSYPEVQPLDAKFNVTYPAMVTPQKSNFWILDTDYDNYALVWSCRPIDNGHSVQFARVISKQRVINSMVLDKVDAGIAKYYDRSRFHTTLQTC